MKELTLDVYLNKFDKALEKIIKFMGKDEYFRIQVRKGYFELVNKHNFLRIPLKDCNENFVIDKIINIENNKLLVKVNNEYKLMETDDFFEHLDSEITEYEPVELTGKDKWYGISLLLHTLYSIAVVNINYINKILLPVISLVGWPKLEIQTNKEFKNPVMIREKETNITFITVGFIEKTVGEDDCDWED